MRLSFFAMALALAAPAAAQPPPSDEEPADIVVTGNEADREKRIREFVEALSDIPGTDPLARFDRVGLCPGVAGLNDAQNAAIAARMRAVAQAAQIPLADAGCRPNALVIVARDKKETIAALRRRHPIYFRNAVNQPIEIPRQPGPATAWHLDGRLDRSGVPVPFDEERRFYVLNSPMTPSRISAAMRPIFLASVVVIEVDSLVGLTTTQIADYAAMRAFAETDPARLKGTDAPTILTVLDAPMDSLVPASLTQWDLSYLRALYATAKHHSAARQRVTIRRRMARDLKEAEPAEN